MDITKIISLVKQGESDTLEFKKSTSQLSCAFETVCAFLNGKGGTILIGVTDNGKIIGQQVSDGTKQSLANENNKIEPHSELNVTYVPIENGNQIIVIEVPTGNHIPYVYYGRPYIKNQSTTIQMSQHRYEQLLVKRGQLNHAWEECLENTHISDLDTDLILRVVRLAVDAGRLDEREMRATPSEILEKLNLLVDKKLTRAAIILFCKNESKQFIQSQLRLARFKGVDKQEFIDSKLIINNAFLLYDHAIKFLENYLPVSGKIVDGRPNREEIPAIPYKVLRETIVNALSHRDYSIRGGAINLAIFDDRIEISNTGTLPEGIKLSDLTNNHRSLPRNPLIAKVFYASGFIEMWGRGTQKIIELSLDVGNPEPIFESTNFDFTVRLPLQTPINIPIHQDKTYLKFKFKLNNRQEEILNTLKSSESMTIMEIFNKSSLSTSRRTLQADLAKLRQYGLVANEKGGRSTLWISKLK